MNRCETCKYWTKWQYKNIKYGECDRIDYVYAGDNVEDQAQSYVNVLDDSGLNVNFITMADFGCTLWVEKV